MNATTKKIYSLVSAIVLVVLSVLLVVGTFLPVFTINMGTIETAEAFENGYFTEGLEIDEAKIGFGNVLKLVINRKYVSVINSVQSKEQKINDTYKMLAESDQAGDEWKQTQLDNIATWREEITAILDTLTEEDYEKMRALFEDKGFINALYAEIGFISLFSDAVDRNSGDNYKYNTNFLDVFTVIFGMIFLAGFMICTVIFAIIAFFSALKRVFSLATGFKRIDLKKLESLYAGKAMAALLPTFFFYILAKAMFGSRFVMGAGLWLILIAAALIGVLRAVNKIMLKEKRNPKHIARVLIGLLSFIFVLCIFNNITNMDLAEAYYRSNAAHVEEVYQAKYNEALTQSILNNPSGSISGHQYTAESAAKTHVTEILTKNAFPLVAAILLVSIFTFILFSRSFNRLRENNDDFRSSYSAEKCGAHYVVALLLLLCVLFTGTLGVITVDERDQAYLDGGVKILWNDYTLEDSGVKEEYDELVTARTELLVDIEKFEEELKSVEDEELKAEYSFELNMAKRYANKLALRIDSLENNDTARRTTIITLLVVVIVLEVIYRAAPGLVDKYLPNGVKRFLAGRDDEAVDTSMGGAPATYSAPASAPASYAAPDAYSAPAKAKSFDKKESSAPQGGASGGDDLADEMQRMFDSQR